MGRAGKEPAPSRKSNEEEETEGWTAPQGPSGFSGLEKALLRGEGMSVCSEAEAEDKGACPEGLGFWHGNALALNPVCWFGFGPAIYEHGTLGK